MLSYAYEKRVLDQDLRRPGPRGQPRLQWGYIIYRTAYGPGSDQLWQALLDQIQSYVRKSILYLSTTFRDEPDDPEEVAVRQQLASLFHLDTREDEQTLSGASMEAVREIANREAESLEAGMQEYDEEHQLETSVAILHRYGVFLYVDEQVLQQQAIRLRGDGGENQEKNPGWIKVVEVGYDGVGYGPHPRVGPQRYFGAMLSSIDALREVWDYLGARKLSLYAPPLRDGELAAMWDDISGGDPLPRDPVRVRIKEGAVLEFV